MIPSLIGTVNTMAGEATYHKRRRSFTQNI
jgi:hypothetical protein